MHLKHILKTYLFEYLKASQIHGYKFITLSERPLFERFFWTIIAKIAIILTMLLVISSYLHYLESPTVTSELPNRLLILDLPFPAVAICSCNRISRIALLDYSEFILNSTRNSSVNLGETVEEIAGNLVHIGQFINSEVSSDGLFMLNKIHNVLTDVYDGFYPLTEILTNFTPKCTELLSRCKWQGMYIDCDQLFSTRKTYMGNCCVFNYFRPSASTLRKQQDFNSTITLTDSKRVNKHGPDFGLVLLINHQIDDYAFSSESNLGSKLLIFDSKNFPDIISAAVKEQIIQPEREIFFTLHPIPINGSESIERYSAETRFCVFDDEIKLVFKNFYTLSECLLTCRIESISKFCGCTPPQYSNIFNISFCLLNDFSCILRWKSSWYQADPIANNIIRNNYIIDSHCPRCVSRCNVIRYGIQSSSSKFNPETIHQRWHDPEFISGINVSNHSIITLNFGSNRAVRFDQTAQYMWYELFANLGGLCSLTLGASFISIIEIFYFIIGRGNLNLKAV